MDIKEEFSFAVGLVLLLSVATSVLTIIKFFEEKKQARMKLDAIISNKSNKK